MNKKNLLVSILLSSVSCFSAYAKDAPPKGKTEGEIKFTGYIYSATCTIDVSGNGVTGTGNNPVIDMGRYSTSEFTTPNSEVGGTGGKGEVKVTLTNCPDKGTLTMKLSGIPDTSNDILQLSNSGDSATGVGIVLYHKGEEALNQRIKVNGEKEFTKLFGEEDEATGALKVNFIAKYTRTATEEESITAGNANADLPYEITYN